jgi:hypothetical protein
MTVVPLIVRHGFANANAMHSDLSELIDSNRGEFPESGASYSTSNPLAIILLARTDLGLPQVASPALLPEWLAGLGGKTTEVVIESLAVVAVAPLNAQEARIDEVAHALFEIEGALIARVANVQQSDPRRANALLDMIRSTDKKETLSDILVTCDEHRRNVQNASAYRPSAGEGGSFIGRLVRLASSKSPNELHAVAKSLASALGVDGNRAADVKESLPAVLLRSTIRDEDGSNRFARNLIVTVFAASQFVTAAAHSDDYPGYLVVLLQATSYNLRETLRDFTDFLRSLPPLAPRVVPTEFLTKREAASAE